MPGPFRPSGLLPVVAASSTRALPDLSFMQDDDVSPAPPPSKPTSHPRKTEVLVIADDEDEEEHEALTSTSKQGSDRKVQRERNETALLQLDAEISDVDYQISQLQSLRSSLLQDRHVLVMSLSAQQALTRTHEPSTPKKPAGTIDYGRKEGFSWSDEIKSLAREVWGIKAFRLCQEAAINASMDGKDVVVVMPTGGGKSLIYQLPALASEGTTLVVTPLISLMQDQCYNLSRINVRAEMLHASTSKENSRTILSRLTNGGGTLSAKAKGKEKSVVSNEDGDDREIKLIYVTPERIDKSKTFLSTLQKMYDAGILTRIVIDEAHCLSSMGHDYRPAYLALGRLKTLFPKTPLSALTATAPETVVEDMIKILVMPRATSAGNAASPESTVLFSSPLYRSNLHYSVKVRPKDAAGGVQTLVDWILESHEGETGIVYCFSKADTEAVCKGLNEVSEGKITAAFYHAYIEDEEKIRIHKMWRQKKINVVVSTVAFGLGIDAPDVRFVLHHALSKSLEGYYQESGRAGRDGLDADCVIFYRSSDAARISTLIYGDFYTGGREKLYQILDYAEDLSTCRKLLFSSYFASTHANKSAFEPGTTADDPCGHCDNCLRSPATFSAVSVSQEVYKTLRLVAAAEEQNATLTLLQASDLVRGLGGGSFATNDGKGKGKAKGKIDVKKAAGGKVILSALNTESLLVRLLLDGYLREEFHSTAYSTVSYLRLSQKSIRFTRILPRDSETSLANIEFNMNLPRAPKKAKTEKGKRKAPKVGDTAPAKKKQKTAQKKQQSEEELDDKLSEPRELESDSWLDIVDHQGEVDPGEVTLPESDRSLDEEGWEVWGHKTAA